MDGGRQQGDCPRRHKYIYFEFLIPSFTSSKPNSSFLSLKLSFPQIMILFCQLSKQQNNVVILVIVLRSFPLFSQMLIFDSVYIYIFPPLFLCCFLLCSSRACVRVRTLQRCSALMLSTPFVHCRAAARWVLQSASLITLLSLINTLKVVCMY